MGQVMTEHLWHYHSYSSQSNALVVWNYIPNVTECSDDKKKYNACNEHNSYKYKSFLGELRHGKER